MRFGGDVHGNFNNEVLILNNPKKGLFRISLFLNLGFGLFPDPQIDGFRLETIHLDAWKYKQKIVNSCELIILGGQ